MSSSITPFAFGDNMVRVNMDENGNPWFVAKDVCRVLELNNVSEALRGLDEDEKGSIRITEGTSPDGGNPNMLIISESGLYALVFRSRKPEAKAFSKWVRSEVLPSLRRTGGYSLPGKKPLPSAIPEEQQDMPEEALVLRPALRQRLWRDALETARLDNGGSDAALLWFGRLCRMMLSGRHVQAFEFASSVDEEVSRLVRSFAEDACEREKHYRMGSEKLYGHFRRWCEEACGLQDIPSNKRFSRALQTLPEVAVIRHRPTTIFAGLKPLRQ